MSSAWLLPEHFADVLPAQARRLEDLRRIWLDTARSYGYELVIPPLLEHLESLLSGTGHALDLKTFKLVDQLSGRTLGVRADSTPQVARIDAHLLNRNGVNRMSYCGPVLHTKPAASQAGREPLQLGAEIYGHSGHEADLEIIALALEGLQLSGLQGLMIDLADIRLFDGVVQGLGIAPLSENNQRFLMHALSTKDVCAIHDWALSSELFSAPHITDTLVALTTLYGDSSVLKKARQCLPDHPLVEASLQGLAWLNDYLQKTIPSVNVGFDLSDLSGYAYYSGFRFAIYADGHPDALLRGGRYDEVGAVFGRRRPAVGFSLDLKILSNVVSGQKKDSSVFSICAPWLEDDTLKLVIRQLREKGHSVACVFPGHEQDERELIYDRELKLINGQWQLCLI